MKLFKHLTKKKTYTILFFAIFLSVCIYAFSVRFFERNAYDALVKLSVNKTGLTSIVNVVIDDNSVKDISTLPWKRTLYSDLFSYLEKSGAKLIVFDAVLTAQNDEKNDEEFLKEIKKLDSLVVGVNFSKNENMENSKENLEMFSGKFALNVQDLRNEKYLNKTTYTSFQEMFPQYINTVKTVGAVNTALDTDGSVRAFEPFIYMQGKYYPSLALAVFLKLNDYDKITIYDNKYEIYNKDTLVASFPLNFKKDKYVQYINWLAPYNKNSWIAHEQIKASDIINSYYKVKKGEAPIIQPDKIKDKIIVVGATANALYDLKITPLTVNMPGSTIQANIIDNLLSRTALHITDVTGNVLIMLAFVGLILLLIFYLAPMLSVISIFVVCFLYFYLALFTFSNGYAINIITPYIFFVLSSIIGYSFRFSIEDTKKEKLKNAMKKYISTNVVDDIIQNTDTDLKLGGKKTEITILMADIRGFTKISENLDPSEVTNLLNEYFEAMIPIIEQYGGSVNKFIGDAILAVFNEPKKDKNHPLNAILCAIKMKEKVQEIRKKWKSEGKPDIGISIGINTGTSFIGNIGTQNHMEYTVIGDTVNVASRIEAQNRQFNTQLLISETTYEYAKDMLDVIKISSVPIRGREKHIDIYEIINILDNKNEIN